MVAIEDWMGCLTRKGELKETASADMGLEFGSV
jgi:hypothetical protein